ncbi:NUDIX family hydrolase [Streptococcus varani]|uniref:NUDIX family hydrolase n=1 Tax=Streptococcus varani TaxID=1608583 RepID=A0A0E3WEY6_9STRE|nr:NUDIX family hydrolase [Streptococcus varani]
MSRSEKVILTNMCLIEDGQGNIVIQIRDPERYAWSGAALPGGACVIIMTGANYIDLSRD